jgi:hypothetical protein
MTRLKDCLICLLLALLCALIGLSGYIGVIYGIPIAENSRTTSKNTAIASAVMPETAQNVKDVSATVKGTVEDARKKLAAVNLQPINASLQNVAAITGNVRSNLPKINKAAWVIYERIQHVADNADKASKAERGEQADLTDLAKKNLAASHKAIQDFDDLITSKDIKFAISHTAGTMEELHGVASDGHRVSKHYADILTSPKRWWEKLKDEGEAGVNFALRHF